MDYQKADDGARNDFRYLYFELNPEVAVNFARTWQLGLGLSYGYGDTEWKSDWGSTNYYFSAYGPRLVVRKFFPVTKCFSPFLGSNFWSIWRQRANGFDESWNLYGGSFDLGAAFSISPRFKFFFSYKLLYLQLDYLDGERISTGYGLTLAPSQYPMDVYGFTSIPSANFGFYYVFRQSPSMSKAPEE